MDVFTPEQLQLNQSGTRQRVICLTPHALLTTEKIVPFCQHPGTAPGVDVAQQIVKLAVFERHHRSGHVGLGILGNYGLQCGAVASSIAHDSHNLIVAGTNDADMVLVDLDTPYTVDKGKLHSKSHNTPFDGAELYGKVCATIKGGKLTYQAEI